MEIREKMARELCKLNGQNPDEYYSRSGVVIYYWEDFLADVDTSLQVLAECEWPNPDKEPQSCHDFHVGYAKDCIKAIQQGSDG